MADLTPTMRMCLEAIEAEQGQPAKDLPGGTRTVWALMRRGLVETDTERDVWRTFLPAHKHEFKSSMHLDGCHWFQNNYRCDCGVVYGSYGERGVKADPYSAMWFQLGDEGEEPCQRCRELLHGARPVYEVVIQRPAGYTPPLEVVA